MIQRSYLLIQEVAQRFGVNPTTIYRLAQRGELPAFKVGGQWRFSEAMLEAWVADSVLLERQKNAHKSPKGEGARGGRKKTGNGGTG